MKACVMANNNSGTSSANSDNNDISQEINKI